MCVRNFRPVVSYTKRGTSLWAWAKGRYATFPVKILGPEQQRATALTRSRFPPDSGTARAVCFSAVAGQIGRCYAADTKAGCCQTTRLHRAVELDLCSEVDCPCGAVGRCCAGRCTGVCGGKGDRRCWLRNGVGSGVASAVGCSCGTWAGRSACKRQWLAVVHSSTEGLAVVHMD